MEYSQNQLQHTVSTYGVFIKLPCFSRAAFMKDLNMWNVYTAMHPQSNQTVIGVRQLYQQYEEQSEKGKGTEMKIKHLAQIKWP